jgi:hypothetical protein
MTEPIQVTATKAAGASDDHFRTAIEPAAFVTGRRFDR